MSLGLSSTFCPKRDRLLEEFCDTSAHQESELSESYTVMELLQPPTHTTISSLPGLKKLWNEAPAKTSLLQSHLSLLSQLHPACQFTAGIPNLLAASLSSSPKGLWRHFPHFLPLQTTKALPLTLMLVSPLKKILKNQRMECGWEIKPDKWDCLYITTKLYS